MKNYFFLHPLKSLKKWVGSRVGSGSGDDHQNVTDPQQCLFVWRCLLHRKSFLPYAVNLRGKRILGSPAYRSDRLYTDKIQFGPSWSQPLNRTVSRDGYILKILNQISTFCGYTVDFQNFRIASGCTTYVPLSINFFIWFCEVIFCFWKCLLKPSSWNPPKFTCCRRLFEKSLKFPS
jgi:hypothetical protein